MPKKSSIQRLIFQFPKIIKKYETDYTHFQQIAPIVKKGKFITTIHDLLFNDLPDKFSSFYRVSRNFLFKKALNQSEIKLTVSQYSKDSIKQYYGIQNVEITPNAISDAYKVNFDKIKVLEQIEKQYGIKRYILFVSRIEERKNHVLLVKAYRKLKLAEQGINLVLVGRNDIPVEDLDREISNLNDIEKKHFHWLTFVSDEDLLNLYKGAELFVYPSLAEGFGIPPIEAAALGVNTICSNLTAMKDFTFLGENLFDPTDFEIFCNLIEKSLNNPPDENILEQRRQDIYKKYNWTFSAKVLHENIQRDLVK
jgi:glycosyltransferase involved in cell wall biosynthesis